MNYVATLKVFVSLIPINYELVKSLDAIDEKEGTGPAKLQIVLDAVKSAIEQAKSEGVSWETIKPMISALVENLLKIVRR